jgi:hypothetical protein
VADHVPPQIQAMADSLPKMAEELPMLPVTQATLDATNPFTKH